MKTVIEVNEIRKTYGKYTAVDGISLDVQEGEILGIVGPNGAGKSTTVETMMGIRHPTSGTVSVLGMDPHRERTAVAQRIGIQLQSAALPERIKVWEALNLFSTFYKHTVPWEPLLTEWGLTEKRNTAFGALSGGQKQRLFIALALINDPDIVFLDELTTGLDPQARRGTWELVSGIRERGKTVVLVTHFMDEAQELCDRVGIIDKGKMIALNSPAGLIQNIEGETRVLFSAENTPALDTIKTLPPVVDMKRKGQDVVVYGRSEGLLAAVLRVLESDNIPFSNLRSEQPNLEDVFLSMTGRAIRA